jgi:hypothetical protein
MAAPTDRALVNVSGVHETLAIARNARKIPWPLITLQRCEPSQPPDDRFWAKSSRSIAGGA